LHSRQADARLRQHCRHAEPHALRRALSRDRRKENALRAVRLRTCEDHPDQRGRRQGGLLLMNAPAAVKRADVAPSKYDFETLLRAGRWAPPPLAIDTLQVNITKLCNQVCRHCHVDASPSRTEKMSREGIDRCLEILERHREIARLDITGGAPE